MMISPLSLGKLNLAYEAYLRSLGISTSSFVLKGELMDFPELPIPTSLGAANPSNHAAVQGSKGSSELGRKSTKQLLTLAARQHEISEK